MPIDGLLLDPPPRRWLALAEARPRGKVLGRTLEQWREQTRGELQLPQKLPIIATGHQPSLWHPGILAKYLAVDVVTRDEAASSLNIIVDQDVVEFSKIDVPWHDSEGRLTSRLVDFSQAPRTAHGTPVGLLPPFTSASQPLTGLSVSPEYAERIEVIAAALAQTSTSSNAAEQVAAASAMLMQQLVGIQSMPARTASALMRTSLAAALLASMKDDPRRCAQAYNRAAELVPNARVASLQIRDDYVELPVWRIRSGEQGLPERIRGYDADVEAALDDEAADRVLLPRALLMTAIIRIGVSDLFIHGRGGAMYDRIMETWIRDWLEVDVAPMAVASADVRLPLLSESQLAEVRGGGLAAAAAHVRRLEADPEAAVDAALERPSAGKRALLEKIAALPRRSRERRVAFLSMHERLEVLRQQHAPALERAREEHERMRALTIDAATALRRDWCFALYPSSTLQELRSRVESNVRGP